MSIQVRNTKTEKQISLVKPSFGVTEEFNGKFVETSFQLDDQDIKLLFMSMITFNRKSPDFGFAMSPDRDAPGSDEFIKTLKIFDKLGKSFKKKKFYSNKTYIPMYTAGSQYPYDLSVSYGNEFDFKVGDGPVQTITQETKHMVVDMMKPSNEGPQKITNLNCEVTMSINAFTPQKTGKPSYRFRMTIVKLHIIPYKKQDVEPTKFTISLSDDDESEEDEPEEDESEQDEPEPEEIED